MISFTRKNNFHQNDNYFSYSVKTLSGKKWVSKTNQVVANGRKDFIRERNNFY